MIKHLKDKLYEYLDGYYTIGLIENFCLKNLSDNNLDIKWVDLNGYKGGWFADPFILEISNTHITLLTEEFRYSTGLGRISKLVVNRNNLKLESVEPLLEKNTHLSFPYIINETSKIYFVPENYQNCEVSIYSLDKDISKISTIINDILLDTQIFKIDSTYYAVGIRFSPDDNFNNTKVLYVYKSSNLFNDFEFKHTITSDNCDRRGAGNIFCINGKLIRPAQICDTEYGIGVVFYEISVSEEGIYSEKEIYRILADKKSKNCLKMHTFSVNGKTAVIDGFDYKSRILGKFSKCLYGAKTTLYKYLHK